jgi:hypothetical protein
MTSHLFLENDIFTLSLGARAIGAGPLMVVDQARYRDELALKAQILASDPRFYYQAPAGSEPLQWDVLAYVLPRLARDEPQHFELRADGDRWTWRNHLLGEDTALLIGDAASLPHPPLDWLGRQVQEDLLLLGGTSEDGFPLVAGQLCFANRWSLDEKLGLPFAAIHAPVPGFEAALGRGANLLLERLKSERPVWRMNWAIAVVDRLNLAPHLDADLGERKRAITSETAGKRCFFRVERQTLARLPHTGTILFTVHTYQAAVAALAGDPEWRRRMLGVLRTTPPAMLEYKGIAPFAEALLAYLLACDL